MFRMTTKTTLSPEEIQAMFSACRCQRDQVLLQFYADTGCRVTELLKIKVEDIDFKQRLVRIPHLKRGAKKHCPVCSHIAGHNSRWCVKCGSDLSQIQPIGLENRGRLVTIGEVTAKILKDFTEGMGKQERVIALTRQHVYHIIRELSAAAGLKGKILLNPETGRKHFVHPHILRASLATDWLAIANNDANMQKALQEQLGHQSFNTTMRYNRLTLSQVRGVASEVRKARFGKKNDGAAS